MICGSVVLYTGLPYLNSLGYTPATFHPTWPFLPFTISHTPYLQNLPLGGLHSIAFLPAMVTLGRTYIQPTCLIQ